MRPDLNLARPLRRLLLAAGLAVAASTAAQAQDGPPPSGVSYAPPPAEAGSAEAAPTQSRARRSRAEIRPYLEVAQVVSADLDGGDTLTYTSVAAGVDGRVQTRRVTVQMSYRYQRNIEWSGEVGDQDVHSGIAQIGVEVVPGALQMEAGAIATRTGGQGRAVGTTDRDEAVEVYGAYAGPTLSTHAGPVAVNAAYRLGYVTIDDDMLDGAAPDQIDSAVTHSATASVGMAPGRLPVGWTVGAGYARSENDSEFDDEFEGAYVRGDVVVPVTPTLALTAGVGYEDIQASQLDFAEDANGDPIVGPDGGPVADPNRPRVLTYDLSGIIYDAGLIWRPSARTELQVRAGHRYGGTTVVGSLSHQFSAQAGVGVVVYDTVETAGNLIVSDLSNLPDEFEVVRNPLTGSLGGCVFGADPGSGACLDRGLQSLRGSTFRMRGASLVVSGERGLWSWGIGAGYNHRRYGRPDQDPDFDLLGGNTDENYGVYASLGRQLSRSSQLDFDLYANWFDTDEADFDKVFTTGATASYTRRLLLDRMRLLAALGIDHTDDGTLSSTALSGLLGLRYTF
ncbi:hypothetical protein [Sphingosinicella terrae]|uniref:hypothetical protein n=1 Tax=Sphingosinicella terrae TaxID=2172047 RepID=UPI000E0CD427|nr:hypothetical protein [Sphingosinicella terrae]